MPLLIPVSAGLCVEMARVEVEAATAPDSLADVRQAQSSHPVTVDLLVASAFLLRLEFEPVVRELLGSSSDRPAVSVPE